MKPFLLPVVLSLVAMLGLSAVETGTPPASGSATTTWHEVAGLKVPVLKMPLYVMEFHLWYDAPVGSEGRQGWFHGGASAEADTASMGPDWMRMRYGVGWPLPGAYESGDPGIIRWQLQCLKQTGVDGVFIQLFANWGNPEVFLRTPEFETILRIAADEGVKVAIHDEVQFRNPPAKDPAIMAKRAGEALQKYGSSPAYLHIAGKPAYAFQWWGQLKGAGAPGMSHEQLATVMQQADAIVGHAAFWMPFRHSSDRQLLAMPGFGGGVVMSNCNTQFRTVTKAPASGRFEELGGYSAAPLAPVMIPAEVTQLQQARRDFPGKQLGLWAYPGFNNSTQHASSERVEWLPRNGGRTLVDTLTAFQDYGCDFVMLSSWNDWEENTAIEPGFMYDGYAGDPYLACRIVAAAKDRAFTPPALPPKESVDPWMWQRLYGIDRTPPRLTRSRYLPLEPALIVEAVDSGSAVAGLSARTQGDWWCAVGADGTASGRGVQQRNQAVIKDGAWLLGPGQYLEFNLDKKLLQGQDQLWIAVEYEDSANGALVITYPASQGRADNRPTDEGHIDMRATLGLTGAGGWDADSRLLRKVDPAGDKPLVVRFDGKEGAVRVVRVDLFTVRTAGAAAAAGIETETIPGLEISGAAATSQVKSYRLTVPDLQRPIPGVVYVEVNDASGNWSHPIPVGGSHLMSGFGNRP